MSFRFKKHHSNLWCSHSVKKPLTAQGQYGLMRPVARIAQSVEQGIENPRVLGSIPSPGTIIQNNPLMAGFSHSRFSDFFLPPANCVNALFVVPSVFSTTANEDLRPVFASHR